MGCEITGGHWLNSSGMVIITQRCAYPEVCLPGIVCSLNHLQASWTCGDSCLAPEDQVLACSECEGGLQLSLQQLSNQEVPPLTRVWPHVYDHTLQVLDEIFSQLEGSGFCTGTKDEDLCNVFLPMATYQGLPLLAEGMIPDTWLLDQVCNQAVSGTCWTRFPNSPIIKSSFLKLSVYKSLFNDCNRVFTNKSFRRATQHLKCQMLGTSQINWQIVRSLKHICYICIYV